MSTVITSNTEWRAYGQLNYGASEDIEAGLKEWAMLKEHLNQYGLKQRSCCVEIGCGAGRLTNALAEEFDSVQALDVSPDRLEQAGKVPNAAKVRFHLVDAPKIPLPDATCDLCISTHVLQHVASVHAVESYLREMARVLRPGGGILIHVPVIGAHGMTGELQEVLRRRAKELAKSVVLRMTRTLMKLGMPQLPWKIDHYSVFSFVKLRQFLSKEGFVDIELRLVEWAGGHAYLLARRP